MTGLFKKKTKKDDVGSLPSDMRDVGSQGRTDSMPTYHDVPIELQTIDKQLSKLKIYKGKSHPHEVQNPEIIDFAKINSKNKISIN